MESQREQFISSPKGSIPRLVTTRLLPLIIASSLACSGPTQNLQSQSSETTEPVVTKAVAPTPTVTVSKTPKALLFVKGAKDSDVATVNGNPLTLDVNGMATLAPGTYTVAIKRGEVSWSQSVTLSAGQPTTIVPPWSKVIAKPAAKETRAERLARTRKQRRALRIFERGKRQLRRKNIEKALELFQEAYSVYEHPYIEYRLASVYTELGQPTEACPFWQKVDGQIRKFEVDIQLHLAECALIHGDAEAALERLEPLKRRVRRAKKAYFQILMSDVLLRTGNLADAEPLLNLAMKRRLSGHLKNISSDLLYRLQNEKYGFPLDSPERTESAGLVDKAQKLRGQKRYQSAIRALLRAIHLQPHPKQIVLRDALVREWLESMAQRSTGTPALTGLAEGLRNSGIPDSLRHDVSQALLSGAEAQLGRGATKRAALLATASREFEDTDAARRVLTQAMSSAQKVFVPKGVYSVGTSTDQLNQLVKDCRGQTRDPSKCREHRFRAELEQHRVQVQGFYLGRYEVTVNEYRACVDAGICTRQHFDIDGSCPYRKRNSDKLPMTCVDWSGAQQYCSYVGGRLPTESEWEIAASGMGRRIYPWGFTAPNSTRANYADKSSGREGTAFPFDNSSDDGYARTASVGSFPRGSTPSGLMDMAGNVAEWCLDWYKKSSYSPATGKGALSKDPRGPCDGRSPCSGLSKRSVRGAGYQGLPFELRNRGRKGVRPNETKPWLGFRCAWDVR